MIIISRHELGFDRPVLASDILLKGLPSRLRLLVYNLALF
jgi:hypothetical protein